MKYDGPFGDPRKVGKTNDKNAAAILDEFDAVDSYHDSSCNSSFDSSNVKSSRKKEKRKSRLKTYDAEESFDNFIPKSHRTPEMIR